MRIAFHPDVWAFRRAIAQAGVDVVSDLPLFRWSSPQETERVATLR